MKKLITGLLCVVGLLTISTAEAQLRFGIRAGVNVSDLSFSKDIMKCGRIYRRCDGRVYDSGFGRRC